MSLETGSDSLLLGAADADDDAGFAALDSMSPAPVPFGVGDGSDGSSDRVGDGRGNGYSGVGESLFDRIRYGPGARDGGSRRTDL